MNRIILIFLIEIFLNSQFMIYSPSVVAGVKLIFGVRFHLKFPADMSGTASFTIIVFWGVKLWC